MMNKRTIVKTIVLLIILQSLVHALPIFASEPANRACVGKTVAAQAGPEWGEFTVYFAQEENYPNDQPGIGDEYYYLRNGRTPDFILDNYCNDESQENEND